MKKIKAIIFAMLMIIMVISPMSLVADEGINPMDADYTELAFNDADIVVGTPINISLLITPQDGEDIDTVEINEITYTNSLINCTGFAWGDLFTTATIRTDPVIDYVGGYVNDSTWASITNTSSPGYFFYLYFDTLQPGTAYVNITYSSIGIANGGQDMPKKITNNATIIIQDMGDKYIYAGGANSKSVFEYYYDDLTKSHQTVNHTGNIWEVLADDDYLYVATDNPANRVYKYDLPMLTEQGSYDYGDFIYAMTQDEDYIYLGGSWAVGTVHQIWKSNMTKKGETIAYGSTGSNIRGIAVDDTYIYVGGQLTRTIKTYLKSDLSYVGVTANFGSEIYGVVLDDTYVYACGGKATWSTGGEVKQYWQSNLTQKASIIGLSGGILRSMGIDNSYIYAGGTEDALHRIWKTNMTEKDNTTYGGPIYAMHITNEHIYAGGGTTNKVCRYYLSNMTKKDESETYAGTIYGIALGITEKMEPNYMPVAFDEDPTDLDTDISIFYNQVSVNITDLEGDIFNVFIHSNYLTNVSLYDQVNGTFSANLNTPLPFEEVITWHVDIQSNSSNMGNWANYTFTFTTEGKPDIVYVNLSYNSSTPGWQYDRFDDIQDGIDGVAENGTVYVHAGDYYLIQQILINKRITLSGPNAMFPGYSEDRTDEATIHFQITSGRQYGVEINTHDVVVEGFFFYNSSSALHSVIVPRSSDAIYGLTVQNNRFKDIYGYAYFGNPMEGGIVGDIYDLFLKDNLVEDVLNSAKSGFFFATGAVHFRADVSGNRLINPAYAGMQGDLVDTVMENNFVNGSTHQGIQLADASSNVSVVNNTISTCGLGGSRGAIRLYSEISDIIIENNILSDSYYGIQYHNGSGTFENVVIIGNEIINNTVGLFNPNNAVIKDNTVTDNDVGIKVFGIGNLIYNNYFNNTNNAYDNTMEGFTIMDYGDNSSFSYQNDRYELHTESDDGTEKFIGGYLENNYEDSEIKSRIQKIDGDDDYLAYHLFRLNPGTLSGYVCGVSSGAHLWFGKLTGGVYSSIIHSGTVPNFNSSDIMLKTAIIGNEFFAKVWNTSETEPLGWHINTTDSSYSNGVHGIMLATYPTLSWDNVSVAFSGIEIDGEKLIGNTWNITKTMAYNPIFEYYDAGVPGPSKIAKAGDKIIYGHAWKEFFLYNYTDLDNIQVNFFEHPLNGVDLPHSMQHAYGLGDIVYLIDSHPDTPRITSIDVSDFNNPIATISVNNIGGAGWSIDSNDDNLLFTGQYSGTNRFKAWEINSSDPTDLTEIYSFNDGGGLGVLGVAYHPEAEVVYAATYSNALIYIFKEVDGNWTMINNISTSFTTPNRITYADGYIYVTQYDTALIDVYDVSNQSNAENPQRVLSGYTLHASTGDQHVAVYNDILYTRGAGSTLAIYDVSNKSSPVFLNLVEDGITWTPLSLEDDILVGPGRPGDASTQRAFFMEPMKNIVEGQYLGGNYWSDYNGEDTDGDGLGDTLIPYDCNDDIATGGDEHPLIAPIFNSPPVFGVPTPPDSAINQNIAFSWSISITDSDGDRFDWSIECSNGQSNNANNDTDGVKSLALTNLNYNATYTVWVNATDGIASTNTTFTFTTKESSPPILSNPQPYNGEPDVSIGIPSFNIQISDPDGDRFDWSIEICNGINFSGINETSGTKFAYFWDYLEYNTTYTVWVNVTENTNSMLTTKEIYTFITEESTPPDISLLAPVNLSFYLSVYHSIFNVTIVDPAPRTLTIEFYINSSAGERTGTVYNATEGIVQFDFSTLPDIWWHEHATIHEWYVIVDDGVDRTKSEIWTFNTSEAPDINEDGVVNYLDLSILVSNYGKSGYLPGEHPADIVNNNKVGYLDVSMLVSNYNRVYI